MPKKRLDVAFLSLPTPYYTQKHPHASKVMMHKFLETLTFISSVSLDTQSIDIVNIYSHYTQSIYSWAHMST